VLQADLAADRATALALVPVSRETEARLDCFVGVLTAWQSHTNLIAASTESTLWTRHIADSLQLIALVPNARSWADLGSGAGFPGLAIACALAGRSGVCVHLVESNQKKASFLREAVQATGAAAAVHAVRIDAFIKSTPDRMDIVTARALAPLPKLLDITYPLLKRGAVGLFPKGQDVGTELTEAAKYWNIDAALVPSRTDPRGRIIVLRGLTPKL
jgi:16S rRNA (guanine527-N7)-methyltransferase